MKKKILVFPCGSEVALEIFRSVRYSRHFELIGGSSIQDNGRFFYERYIGDIPFLDDEDFIDFLKKIIKLHDIDAIYPAMDAVALKLKENENNLRCKVIGSSLQATQIASSKKDTYSFLKQHIPTPKLYDTLESALFPLFIKPDRGYGSRGVGVANSLEEAKSFMDKHSHYGEFLLCELLTGEEYTIDCFSSDVSLLFFKARQRKRVLNGISVGTFFVDEVETSIKEYAQKIHTLLQPRGAWFFQVKRSQGGELKLLEVAVRIAGSSSLSRSIGVNLPLMSLFDAFGYDVDVLQNNYPIELGRALDVKFVLNLQYDSVYVDLDDCLIIDEKVNTTLVSFLYQALNQQKKIILLTKHKKDLALTLKKFRLDSFFDTICHLKEEESKADCITSKKSIFIDDSFQERLEVKKRHDIAVFSPDMIEVLLS